MRRNAIGMMAALALLLAGPAHALNLGLTDDSFANVSLGFTFNFFGTDYTDIYVNSNGNITLGAGDSDYTESVAEFLDAPPRIGGVWDDLNPSAGGLVDATGTATEMVVTWQDLPEFFNLGSNTFSITLSSDNGIWMDFGDMTLRDGIVGISDGLNLADPGETDLSATGPSFSSTVTRYEAFNRDFDLSNSSIHFTAPAVPEPNAVLLFATGTLVTAASLRRRRSADRRF